ncbi:MAG: fibronectin type III domain-containing protein [Treponema sp.]|jgi:hypothetical protein|nr:fibronectin type III domain-containing protein [Treponema sp.]
MEKKLTLVYIISILLFFALSVSGCNDLLVTQPDPSEPTPTPSSTPVAPTGLSASAVSSNEIYLSWNAVSGATGYRVYSAASSSGTKTNITSGSLTSTYANVTGLTAGTTYYYWVTALNGSRESGYSSNAYATTLSSSTPTPTPNVPSAPTGLFAIPSVNEIYLSWNAVTGATSYNIYSNSTNSATGSTLIVSVYSNSATITGIPANTTRYYWVTAVNNYGEGDFSSSASATTLDDGSNPIIFSEGFEDTSSFTLVNGSQVNRWYIGTGTSYAGSRSAYVTSSSSTSYGSYVYNTSCYVHMYRDVTFPASSSAYTLTFYLKGTGESSYDNLSVRLVETSASISTSGFPTGTIIGSTYYSGSTYSSFTLVTISIPASNSGTTKRLVFSWKNDTSQYGTPAAIDNIVLSR